MSSLTSSFVISVKQSFVHQISHMVRLKKSHKSDINGLIIYEICNNKLPWKYICLFKNNIRMCILTCVEGVRKCYYLIAAHYIFKVAKFKPLLKMIWKYEYKINTISTFLRTWHVFNMIFLSFILYTLICLCIICINYISGLTYIRAVPGKAVLLK